MTKKVASFSGKIGVTLSVTDGLGDTNLVTPLSAPKKTIGAIKIKSGTNHYVREGNPHAKFGDIVITGRFSPYR